MKLFVVLITFVVLLAVFTDASPILTEKQAKQVLRTKRSERAWKPGHADEPMRIFSEESVLKMCNKSAMDLNCLIDMSKEYMLYLQRLEQRSEEQFYEHWWNPHCQPHCNRNIVNPV